MKGLTPRIIGSLRNYSRETFTKDLMAGIIVGIVALPLAIAFGIASGVTPEKGQHGRNVRYGRGPFHGQSARNG